MMMNIPLSMRIIGKVAGLRSKARAASTTFLSSSAKSLSSPYALSPASSTFARPLSSPYVSSLLDNGTLRLYSTIPHRNTVAEDVVLPAAEIEFIRKLQRDTCVEHKDLSDVLSLVCGIPLPPIPELRPKELQHHLGRFYKKPLPFTRDRVDARLFDNENTQTSVEAIADIEKGTQYCIFLGKSGAGKTRALFDIARRFFTIYMECIPFTDERLSSGDKCFRKLSLFCSELDWTNAEVARSGTHARILRELVARTLFLYLYSQYNPKLTPQQYLLSQINGGQGNVARYVNILDRLPAITLRKVQESLLILLASLFKDNKQKELVFAVDESAAAHDFLNGRFFSPKTHSPRGLLTPITSELVGFDMAVCFAATNRSLGHGETIQSDIGKEAESRIYTQYKSAKYDSVDAQLNENLNLEGCDLTAIPDSRLLVGRQRLANKVVEYVGLFEPKMRHNTKQEVLETAIRSSVSEHRNKLEQRLKAGLARGHSEHFFLRRVYASCYMFGGCCGFLLPEEEIDLVEIGIGSLELVGFNATAFRLEEPLSVEVILSVFKEINPIGPLLAHLQGIIHSYGRNTTLKGDPWGMISVCALRKLASSPLNVAEFATKCGLPAEEVAKVKWARDTWITISDVGRVGDYGAKQEPELLDRFLQNIQDGVATTSMVTHTNTVMRADSFGVATSGKDGYIAIVNSSKLYGATGFPSAGIDADLTSTRWDRMYQPKDLSKQSNTKVAALWEDVLRKHSSLQHRGSLRIHTIMPRVQTQTAARSCFVDGNDVVVFIDLENASVLFDSDTIQLISDISSPK